MEIGKNIKRLRRERDMTQEQLAEYLNVTTPAISQWESGKTMPDISIIPVLCTVLKVSSDELLDISEDRREAEIKEIIDRAYEIGRHGDFDAELDIFREGLKRYPDSYELMMWFILNMDSKAEISDESVRHAEKIVEGCTDIKTRLIALDHLAAHYKRVGDDERVEEILNQFPLFANCESITRVGYTRGDKQIEAEQEFMFIHLLQFFSGRMAWNFNHDSGEPLYTEDEVAELQEKRIALLNLIFERGDYGFYYDRLGESHMLLSKHYAKKGNAERAIHQLEAAADAAIGFDSFMYADEYVHESLLFRGYKETAAGIYMGEDENNASILLGIMGDGVYDNIRGDARFRAVEERMRNAVGKWSEKGI